MTDDADAPTKPYDIAVIGGGPAGLHAALKAALLFKSCILIDKGPRLSRIFFAPRVDNIPGFPKGISGRELIQNARTQIEDVEKELGRRFVTFRDQTEVSGIQRDLERAAEGTYELTLKSQKAKDGKAPAGDGNETIRARNVILATGSVDRQPITREYRKRDIETILPYANRGLAEYCLLCDGHLVDGKKVAVIGCGPSAAGVAASLKKNFNADTTLVTCGGLHPDHPEDGPEIPEKTRQFLNERNIPILEDPIEAWFGLKEGILGIQFQSGDKHTFDKGFISMGWYSVNNQLALALGAAVDREGQVKTTEYSEVIDQDGNEITGFFAIGDVRARSWNQIPIAWGQAETAVIHAFANHL